MINQTQELKPCPFCGGEDYGWHEKGCFFHYKELGVSKSRLLQAWNTRTHDEALQLENKAFKERNRELERFLESINIVAENVGAFRAIRQAAKRLLSQHNTQEKGK